MSSRLKRLTQILFMFVFLFLLIRNKQVIWMGIFLVSLAGSFIFGRFYCGWICPINSLLNLVDWIYKKLGIKRKEIPDFLKKPFFRYITLILLVGGVVVTLATGKKLPALIIMALAGTFISLFYVPALWHRYLCPYGLLLSFVGRFSKYKMNICHDNCVKCGMCKNVCPADAIIMENNKDYPIISAKDCLLCLNCSRVCSKKTIVYSHQDVIKQEV